MIVLVCAGFISWKKNQQCLMFLLNFIIWFSPNSMLNLKFFDLIMVVNMFPLLWNNFFLNMSPKILSWYSPTNGVAKRKNYTLLEISRALIFEARMSARFWPEVIATATYLTKRFPTKSLHFQTPLATLNTFTAIPSSHSYLLAYLGVSCMFTFYPG